MVTGNLKILFRTGYRNDYQSVPIATLGPPGTSSEFVARHLSKNISLFPSYGQAEEHIHGNEQEALLLVANAYQFINKFYISEKNKTRRGIFLRHTTLCSCISITS